MGLTIAWYMGADVSSYVVLAAWIALTVCWLRRADFLNGGSKAVLRSVFLVSGERRKNERRSYRQ